MEKFETAVSPSEVSRFEKVRNFKDLATVIMADDQEFVRSGWSINWPQNKPGNLKDTNMENKLDWLLAEGNRYHLDEWWLFDSQGAATNLGEIARKINPNWQEGEEWIGKINRDERLSVIRESWLEASKAKSVEVAQELGGRVHHFATPLMEAGISSIILLKEKATDNVLFRGVRERGEKVLKHQVCGMLREGIGEDGNRTIVQDWSRVVQDQEIKRTVLEFAEEPTRKLLERLIDLYKEKGFKTLQDESMDALKSLERRSSEGLKGFDQAMLDLHVDLMEGIVGNSPYVATYPEVFKTQSHTGKMGTIIVCDIKNDRLSSKIMRGNERLVKGWINRDEIVAVIPVNKQYKESDYDKLNRSKIDETFQEAGKEISQLLLSQT